MRPDDHSKNQALKPRLNTYTIQVGQRKYTRFCTQFRHTNCVLSRSTLYLRLSAIIREKCMTCITLPALRSLKPKWLQCELNRNWMRGPLMAMPKVPAKYLPKSQTKTVQATDNTIFEDVSYYAFFKNAQHTQFWSLCWHFWRRETC